MNGLNVYIIKLLLISLMIEIGGYLINHTSYRNIYRFLSSVIFISVFLTFSLNEPMTVFTEHKGVSYESDINNNHGIQHAFTEDLSEMIERDISQKFSVSADVSVETDFKTLKIHIQNISDTAIASKSDIIQYVRDKYCNPNDEVNSDV